jgi:ribonuclease-3
MKTDLAELQKKINVIFHKEELLQNAFVHRSYLNENKTFPLPSNEKLEFLGDSVLSLVTSIYLYKNYPSLHEGDYTDIKASIVKTESLYEAAKNLSLGSYLYLSKGEDSNNGRESISILADCFEAVIAVIFLDHDFDTAYTFISDFLFTDKLDYIIKNRLYLSAKNKLQELIQNKYRKLPIYQVITQEGPEHNKRYHVGVYFDNKLIGEGKGKSKKIAEEMAAAESLQKMKI